MNRDTPDDLHTRGVSPHNFTSMSTTRLDDGNIDLGSLPGPYFARWSDLPHAFHNLLGRAHERLLACHQHYGK